MNELGRGARFGGHAGARVARVDNLLWTPLRRYLDTSAVQHLSIYSYSGLFSIFHGKCLELIV